VSEGEAARLQAAVRDARRTAHELNNQLTVVIGYGELLEDMVEGEAAELVRLLLHGGRHGLETLRALQRQLHDATDS
jgi:signal transduction histidine kinase